MRSICLLFFFILLSFIPFLLTHRVIFFLCYPASYFSFVNAGNGVGIRDGVGGRCRKSVYSLLYVSVASQSQSIEDLRYYHCSFVSILDLDGRGVRVVVIE